MRIQRLYWMGPYIISPNHTIPFIQQLFFFVYQPHFSNIQQDAKSQFIGFLLFPTISQTMKSGVSILRNILSHFFFIQRSFSYQPSFQGACSLFLPLTCYTIEFHLVKFILPQSGFLFPTNPNSSFFLN